MDAEERVKREEEEDSEVFLERQNPSERCSVSCTSSSSATISDSKWEADRMVKIELDAARALADFAELALLERENPSGESSRKWGHKGRRSKKRVKNETTVGDWGKKNLEDCSSKLKSSSSDLIIQQERSVEAQPWDKKVSKNAALKKIKAEQDSEVPTAIRTCTRNYVSFSGGRSKQILTEAEKEARRVRRVLANRESARQTIRRRQAMCEELTKKAADLALDNESMKRKKELVMKEYLSLKDTNKQLKAQMTRTLVETEEAPATMFEAPASSSETLPLHGYNRPSFTPFIWPSVVQPFSHVQTQTIAQNATRSQGPVAATSKLNPFHEHGNHLSVNGSQTPYYILPCPWFFPLPDHGSQHRPHPLELSHGLRDKQNDGFIGKLHDVSLSLKPMGTEESHQPSLCGKVKTEASSSTEPNSTDNFPKSSIRLSTNVGGHSSSDHREGLVLVPAPLRSVKSKIVVKSENEVPKASTSKVECSSIAGSYVSSALPETVQEASAYTSKKLVDAATAAEARKRRKELTKLKNHQNRQLRLRC